MIDFSKLKALTIPEGVATKIVAGGKTLWEKVKYKNLLPSATDLDRVTIYNGIGYKPDTRLSSSTTAAGSTVSHTGMYTSGFIPAKPGDILRIKGAKSMSGTTSYVILFNSSNARVAYTNIEQHNSNGDWDNATQTEKQSYKNGVLKFTLASSYYGTNFDAVRFSAGYMDANTIVTINQEIPD